MASTFAIKRNDRREPIERTLKGSNGLAVDLTGATVKFLMRLHGSAVLKVNAAATVVSAVGGQVRYSWTAADTDTAGVYDAEFEVTFSDTTKQTFPNAEPIAVMVYEDLG